jgi:hypothetical protein
MVIGDEWHRKFFKSINLYQNLTIIKYFLFLAQNNAIKK